MIKKPIGAMEKLELAKKMREAGRHNVNKLSGGGHVSDPSPVIPATLIFVFATILAAIVTENKTNPLAGHDFTGVTFIDNIVSNNGIVPVTGDPDQDRLITIVGRGLAFFLIAGIPSLLALIGDRLGLRKHMTPYVLCWGGMVLFMLFYYATDSLISFFKLF